MRFLHEFRGACAYSASNIFASIFGARFSAIHLLFFARFIGEQNRPVTRCVSCAFLGFWHGRVVAIAAYVARFVDCVSSAVGSQCFCLPRFFGYLRSNIHRIL